MDSVPPLRFFMFRLHELVKIFLDDPDPGVALSVGSDMRKIQYCFFWLKVMFYIACMYA